MSEKKLYIMIGNIELVGGWQLYIANKNEYLKNTGWDTQVFSIPPFRKNKIKVSIDTLKPFEKNVLRGLKNEMKYSFKWEVNRTLDYAIKAAGVNKVKYDRIVVETTGIQYADWGEELAKRLGAKHFIYSVYALYTYGFVPQLRPFLYYKYQRKELASIGPGFLQKLFGDYAVIPKDKDYYLRAACCGKMINDGVDYRKKFGMEEQDFVIGAFGQLDKLYMDELLIQVGIFSEKHPDKKTGLVIVGGSSKAERKDTLASLLTAYKKVTVKFAGAIANVPKNVFDAMDVCFASHGSARVAASADVKTVVMEDNEGIPYGILGYTIFIPGIYDKRYEEKTVSELLEDVLIERKYDGMEHIVTSIDVDMAATYKEHIDLLNSSSAELKYYDFNYSNNVMQKIIMRIKLFLKRNLGKAKELLKRLIISIVGYEKAKSIKKQIN